MAKGRFTKRHTPVNKKDNVLIICKLCKTEFGVQPYRKNTAEFCSITCARKWQMKGERHHQYKGGKPKCLDCGKELSNYNNKKCSDHKGMVGANNPRWIPNRTVALEKHLLRRCREWKIWRCDVFERDDYTCQECQISGVYLEAHHIIPIRSDRSKAFELNNGITLCRPCHQKTIWKESDFVEKYSQLVLAH